MNHFACREGEHLFTLWRMDKQPRFLSYRPSSFRIRREILTVRTIEEAQVIALALEMHLRTHRQAFRDLGFWPPHVREITELYPFCRKVLADLQAAHASHSPESKG